MKIYRRAHSQRSPVLIRFRTYSRGIRVTYVSVYIHIYTETEIDICIDIDLYICINIHIYSMCRRAHYRLYPARFALEPIAKGCEYYIYVCI